jgi:hypothetical protein
LGKPTAELPSGCLLERAFSGTEKGIWVGKTVKYYFGLLLTAMGYGLYDRVFKSWQRLGIHLFTTTSRTALEPTQLLTQWVPGALSLEVKRPGREADH